MKGSEIKLARYMQGASKRFVIPVYQRNYEWKIENCRQLYDDLVKVIKNGRKSHFFGSVVSVYDDDGQNEEYLVIDGQQRLTTVSILFLAMYNLLKSKTVVAEDPQLCNKIYKGFLIDEWQPEETRIKLKPVKNDMAALKKLFDDKSEHIRESNPTVNYDYFYNRIQKNEITIDELFKAICSLEIIKITLNSDDNPQLIFESLNSTGLDLSEGDKIRNLILMGLPTEQQNQYYERYWNKIEVLTKYDVSAFIRDYLSVKNQSIPSLRKVYAVFKDYVEISKVTTETLLKELLSYAKRYNHLLAGGFGDRVIDGCVYRLNRLETSVIRPFFLEVLRLFDERKLTIEELEEIFTVVESYLFRRTICDLPTNSLNKTFLMLHKEILRYDGTEDNYVEKLKYALLSKKERVRFPDDEEFGRDFTERQIYLMQSKNKVYILERLENFGTAEDKEIYRHCDEGDYSIEHIMPQHLTPAWIDELGEDYEDIHNTWLHRIANLTLTAYNSKYSNNSFADKKNMKNGFIESGIRMNTFISRKDKWTLFELEERSKYLKDRALTIWEYPVTDFLPNEKVLDSFSLADDTSMSNRSITRFAYKNTEQPVSSWVEMYQKVLQILYSEDKSIIIQLAVSNDDGIAAHFSYSESAYRRSKVEIAEGVYVNTNTNTLSKLNILSRMFEIYDIDLSELTFYLKDYQEERENEKGTRYEVRRKYWAYALEFIKTANEDNGAFINVDVSKASWINGYIGITGFNIVCVSNVDCARVEMYLGKSDKSANKQAYDNLAQHKAEIESAVGSPLVWQRGDDMKSSKIYIQLDNVSIENEIDWYQMANFHAQWSKMFFDVLVPIIKQQEA